MLPAFGPRYGNRVSDVGRDDDDVLRRYAAEAEFAGGSRARRLRPPRDRPRPARGAAVPELDWALGAGYEQVAESDRLVLLADTRGRPRLGLSVRSRRRNRSLSATGR